ncbi:MAG: PIG-L family deacetylase [Actinobacteria bacterium]|nr:PIG-L family deacetylase [Actinomycetota bacterium]
MGTLVAFHAHPDDEAISSAGTFLKAAAEGHRVVVVFATRGENGEVADGFLDPGEKLWERRVKETAEACRILGVARHEFLGYIDSGMMGTPENEVAESFWKADPKIAAERVADILREERADVLTVYDAEGTYGHPDHIQVHRIGVRAAELAGTPKVFESVIARSRLQEMIKRLADSDLDLGGEPEDIPPGVPDELITTVVDARPYLEQKRAAMAAHASQISETSFFLAMLPDLFRDAFGSEEYVLRGAPPGTSEMDLFESIS